MNLLVKPAVVAATAALMLATLTGCSDAQTFADEAADAFGVASVVAACGILESTPYGEDLLRQLPALISFAESAVAQDSKWDAFLESLKDVERQTTIAKDSTAAAASLAEAIKVCAANK